MKHIFLVKMALATATLSRDSMLGILGIMSLSCWIVSLWFLISLFVSFLFYSAQFTFPAENKECEETLREQKSYRESKIFSVFFSISSLQKIVSSILMFYFYIKLSIHLISIVPPTLPRLTA